MAESVYIGVLAFLYCFIMISRIAAADYDHSLC